MGGVLASTSHTIVEPFRLVWAPTNRAQDLLPKIAQIFPAIRSTPDWQRRIDEIYRKNGEARRIAQAQRDAESERRTREFIDQIIWEGQGAGGSSGGSVAGGGVGSVAAVGSREGTGSETEPASETETPTTDFWGEPLPETDFWGEPVNRDN